MDEINILKDIAEGDPEDRKGVVKLLDRVYRGRALKLESSTFLLYLKALYSNSDGIFTYEECQTYIYCSSDGVYLKSDILPHFESDAVDPKSRHKGKLDTENLLTRRGINWTSLWPVYIYGPLSYNPVEEWFFHRLKAGRPIPVPNSGLQITQLGHVKDLARAFLMVLGNEKASKQVYNISGAKYVTFAGLAKACAKVAGFPKPEIVYFNPKEYDFGKKKSFPLRDQHFFTSIEKAQTDLGWKPEFDLIKGLADSYNLDFGLGKFRKEPDFSVDDMILNRTLVLQS